MTMKIQRRHGGSIAARWQRGLTMIEVLVAIVVLAIGLLGLAGLQLNGLKVSQGSTFRWKASQLAADLADQLRASRVESTAAPGPCTLTAAGGIQGTCPTGLLATSLPFRARSHRSASTATTSGKSTSPGTIRTPRRSAPPRSRRPRSPAARPGRRWLAASRC
jgi:prepilin-type N-terminal cleavage/methylation domain-containing protein